MVVALWAQLYLACIGAWRDGEYYAYGWYVPPLAGLFCWRIRGLFTAREPRPLPRGLLVLGAIALTAALTFLRVIERVDSRWTLPIWIQTAGVAAISLGVAHRLGGRRAAWRCLPILVFAGSAIPLPSVVERLLVGGLTRSVVVSTTSLLGGLGYVASSMGDQIVSAQGEMVHVTEGCSGIRSAQSFLMASLFFGEWMRLRPAPRVLLLLAGWATAWCVNVARATTLAIVSFEHGGEVSGDLHDPIGLLAFVIGSAILYFVAGWLDFEPGRRVRRRLPMERGAA